MSAGDEGQCPACQSIADSGRALTAHTCDRRRRKPLTQYDPARQDEDYVDFLKWSKDSEGERVKIYTPKLKSVSGGNTVSRPFAEAVKAGKLNSLSYLPDDSPMWELPEAKELRDEALLLRSEHPAHGKTGYFHQAALGVHLRARGWRSYDWYRRPPRPPRQGGASGIPRGEFDGGARLRRGLRVGDRGL